MFWLPYQLSASGLLIPLRPDNSTARGGFVCSRTMRRLRSAWVVSGASIREQINLIGGKSQALFYVAEK